MRLPVRDESTLNEAICSNIFDHHGVGGIFYIVNKNAIIGVTCIVVYIKPKVLRFKGNRYAVFGVIQLRHRKHGGDYCIEYPRVVAPGQDEISRMQFDVGGRSPQEERPGGNLEKRD